MRIRPRAIAVAKRADTLQDVALEIDDHAGGELEAGQEVRRLQPAQAPRVQGGVAQHDMALTVSTELHQNHLHYLDRR
ncbi:MAG: hypothetical protein M1813_006745 [Trichoglossum hirsutum]|nr:MAG: hypothetical protein M1813_006745 [Trichoglossum hirsutum]